MNLIQIPLLLMPSTIHIIYRLAQENPLLYAELAYKPNGLQEYVDAMNEFNWFSQVEEAYYYIPNVFKYLY